MCLRLTRDKSIITPSINDKDIERLDDIAKQLSAVEDNPVAQEQLLRIQEFLPTRKDSGDLTPLEPLTTPVPGKTFKKAKRHRIKSAPSVVSEVDDDISLITDVHLFPRSEYHARFVGTAVFVMDDPSYWGTYHRSESARFFTQAGGRKAAQFSSPCTKKPEKGAHSFFAHTGGYRSPFSITAYSDVLQLEQPIAEGEVNVRDKLLLYKNRMANLVVEKFAILETNEQSIKQKGTRTQHYIRPIVYTENNYPCVLVASPILHSDEVQTEAAQYWKAHPKPFQRLLLCVFVAFLNVEAMHANIPIEIVLRASFGHNLPSVCETNGTFRINVGLIPECYAELISKALHQLNEAVNQITDTKSQPAPFEESFLAQVRNYNVTKLKKAIQKKERYAKLRKTANFQEAEHSDEAFKKLYADFCEINEKSKERKRGSTFMPVNLKEKTIWQAIRQAGDSMGKSVLDECFRQHGTEDWFVNQVMDALQGGDTNPIETALGKLLQAISSGEKVTMDYAKIQQELKREKRKFANPSFETLYHDDSEFSAITQKLCAALLVERPARALYAVLEQAGISLLSTHSSSDTISQDADFGSDSEFSDELFDTEAPRNHISHIKLRVCSGMKAILLAQYGALSYLRSQGVRSRPADTKIEQMYYEVEEAIKYVAVPQQEEAIKRAEVTGKLETVKSDLGSVILHFDLNHCNAGNVADSPELQKRLGTLHPALVILDYTSSTAHQIKQALKLCFSSASVELVMLVESGLKNSQGGLDFNPYGEVRICSRNRKVNKEVLELIKTGLSEADKVAPQAHEMVRVCKRRGMAPSLFGAFKTQVSRHEAMVSSPQYRR